MAIEIVIDRLSYNRLIRGFWRQGMNNLLAKFLKNRYDNLRLFITWGNVTSLEIFLSNDIRHGSILSPYLFIVCVDQLDCLLGNAGIGCHIAGGAMNSFCYADDSTLIVLNATALSLLTSICDDFAKENYIKFNTTKIMCVCILSLRSGMKICPIHICPVMLVDMSTALGIHVT